MKKAFLVVLAISVIALTIALGEPTANAVTVTFTDDFSAWGETGSMLFRVAASNTTSLVFSHPRAYNFNGNVWRGHRYYTPNTITGITFTYSGNYLFFC